MTAINRCDGDFSLVLGGPAGQGIQTVEQGLARLLKRAGYHVFASKEYMSRIRGGSNSSQLRVAARPVAAPLDRIDLFIPLDQASLKRCYPRLSSGTLVLGDQKQLGDLSNILDLPITTMAEQAGDSRYASSVAIGAVIGLFGVSPELLNNYVRQQFAEHPEAFVAGNRAAAAAGYQHGLKLCQNGRVEIDLRPLPSAENDLLLNGSEAVGLGALAGGCNFISSYPMSPATGVLTFLAGQSADLGVVVDQAEDEIAAINAALGAWYSGARALVSTSGGGFALMCEGLSLAGMIESPLVVHLSQRPGPATGLPTRTEQGDLQLALYAGHGEFPRLLLAPGSLQEAYSLSRRAFDLADQYQVPVIILTDQFLVDSLCNIPALDTQDLQIQHHFVETEADYARYRIIPDDLSPRGLPGHGNGLVCVDSDEHDEQGHISEDLALRRVMVDKRLRKHQALLKDAIAPQLLGDTDYQTLVVCWGSTYHALGEALTMLKGRQVAGLHFSQLYPLPPQAEPFLKQARTLVVIEGNATGQFASLLEQTSGCSVNHRILKYNGLPFSVEEIVAELDKILGNDDQPLEEN